MEGLVDTLKFYKNKIVLVTGHTGFKGSWLTKILLDAGANVIGYSLNPPTKPNLFEILNLDKKMTSIIGDIRDFDLLLSTFKSYKPEYVFHLAAQPIVRESYENPLYTYNVNVIGTLNILECLRITDCVKSFVNVTTDKVYENNDQFDQSFVETDKLNGHDPYSNSKSCSEIVTDSYFKCFLKSKNMRVSTARAGNVIGGGDFSRDRIIPDCFRSLESHTKLSIRNPYSIRPYQHVLEPLFCYLIICKSQFENDTFCGAYNIGPDSTDCVTTENLVGLFKKHFVGLFDYAITKNVGPHEASFLRLNNNKMKDTFNWKPKTSISDAVRLTAEWIITYLNKGDIGKVTSEQIGWFVNL